MSGFFGNANAPINTNITELTGLSDKGIPFEKIDDIAAVSAGSFPGIDTVVAISNIYRPRIDDGVDGDWIDKATYQSWYDEEGYGVDGDYHGTLTTTQRDALSPSTGDVCYNSTTTTFQKYSGSAWATTYRGPRRKFPEIEVAVAEASLLNIYNVSGSEAVIWKSFDFTGFTITALYFLGSHLFVATTTGIVDLDFNLDDIDIVLTYTTATTPSLINAVCSNIIATNFASSSFNPMIIVTNTGNDTYNVTIITSGGTAYDIGADTNAVTATSCAISSDEQLTVTRSDGNVYIWNDITAINADGYAHDTLITDALGTPTIVEAS